MKEKKQQPPSLSLVDNMDGHSFEYFCADILNRIGYSNIKVTQASADYGIDIIAYNNGQSYAIQCKNYSSKVSNKAIQEAYSGKDYYHCNYAVVMTNNFYTIPAIKTANELGVILWDRNHLDKMIKVAYSSSKALKSSIIKNSKRAKASLTNSNKKDGGCGCGTFLFLIILIILLLSIFNTDDSDKKKETKNNSDKADVLFI